MNQAAGVNYGDLRNYSTRHASGQKRGRAARAIAPPQPDLEVS